MGACLRKSPTEVEDLCSCILGMSEHRNDRILPQEPRALEDRGEEGLQGELIPFPAEAVLVLPRASPTVQDSDGPGLTAPAGKF